MKKSSRNSDVGLAWCPLLVITSWGCSYVATSRAGDGWTWQQQELVEVSLPLSGYLATSRGVTSERQERKIESDLEFDRGGPSEEAMESHR